MDIRFPEVGVCGLSCKLCPMYNTTAASRCAGCKSPARIAVGCPFITCANKRKGVEFCWDCSENEVCEKWRKHREEGKKRDSFKCYQKLENDIAFVREHGVQQFEREQDNRKHLLQEMLLSFNDGRSKSYYCIAATIFKVSELEDSLTQAAVESVGLSSGERGKKLHSILDRIAEEKGYLLKLRK